jgi:uncharacterized protein YegL
VLHEVIARIEESCPWLARLTGGRLDLGLPAVLGSLLTHVAILTAFAMFGYAANSGLAHKAFDAEVVTTKLEDFATLDTETALAAIDQTTMAPDAGSTAPDISALIVDSPVGGPAPTGAAVAETGPGPIAVETAAVSPALAALALPGAPRLDAAVSLQGSGAEHVGGVEGAVDRIAVEVLRRMEKGRTLVVWAFDASLSLQKERQGLADYIEGVYRHIDELDRGKLAADGGLLTAVVAFGNDRKILTEAPTADLSTIREAILKVPDDATGVETTFRTVAEIARKYGRYTNAEGERYRAVTIVVTDEVGEDENLVEEAVAASRSANMPVYVLGSAALFGRVQGFMDYTDPRTNQTYRRLPVRQGPESLLPEVIRLPFWYNGPQYELMDSGYGPWALSRLAGASGGVYFITRLGTDRVHFDPVGLREYKPDWSPREQYLAAIARNPLRQAVLAAAAATQQNLPAQPDLTFPPADTQQFKDAMVRNQETVARTMYTVDEALAPITAVVKRRDHETSRRWQAHYDLIRGRLLAVKLRCYEYNWACAQMKKDPRKFANPKSNAWRLVPDPEVKSSEKAAAAAEEAKSLLQRVVEEHPGTPWGLLAQRELKDPFGFKWAETYVPPPPREREGAENAARKKAQQKKAMARPPDPPKL